MRILNSLIGYKKDLIVGDFILFQEYDNNSTKKMYTVSNPIYGIYLGSFVADQTIGFNYVKWINERREVDFIGRDGKKYKDYAEVREINCHIEWDDFVDILGHWDHRPSFSELSKAYRSYNKNKIEQWIDINSAFDVIVDENKKN